MSENSQTADALSTPTKPAKLLEPSTASTRLSSPSARKLFDDDPFDDCLPLDRLTDTDHRHLRSNADRYLPNRSTSNLASVFASLADDSFTDDTLARPNATGDLSNTTIRRLLKTELLGIKSDSSSACYRFQNKNILSYSRQLSDVTADVTQTRLEKKAASTPAESAVCRRFAKHPFKVLDAPALRDDFYLNLLDWSD